MANELISPSDIVRIRHRTIAAKYKAHDRDRRKPPFSLSARRLCELERLYETRWGNHLPDDDAGRDDLLLAFNHIKNAERCVAWALTCAPWLTTHDAASLAEQVMAAPQWLKARSLGDRLGLRDAERTALDIRTIRPIDITDEALHERRKQKDRERQARKRRLQRAGKPAPLSQTKPWVAEGISRRTWYRRQAERNGTKPVRDNLLSITADGICATMPPAIAVGTPCKLIKLIRVDGAAVVGNPSRRFKTRFPTAARLNNEQRQYALTSGFEPEKILRMFEMYRDHNIAQRTYSPDWGQSWMNWVDREVGIVNAWHKRASRRAYFERLPSEPPQWYIRASNQPGRNYHGTPHSVV
jgi:hypothetical protein